jgi:hypothetical protein
VDGHPERAVAVAQQREEWGKQIPAEYAQWANRQIEELQKVACEAWEAWHKSKQEKSIQRHGKRSRPVSNGSPAGATMDEMIAELRKEVRDGSACFLNVLIDRHVPDDCRRFHGVATSLPSTRMRRWDIRTK